MPRLGPGPRVMVGVLTVLLFAGLSVGAWDGGYPWLAAVFGGLDLLRLRGVILDYETSSIPKKPSDASESW